MFSLIRFIRLYSHSVANGIKEKRETEDRAKSHKQGNRRQSKISEQRRSVHLWEQRNQISEQRRRSLPSYREVEQASRGVERSRETGEARTGEWRGKSSRRAAERDAVTDRSFRHRQLLRNENALAVALAEDSKTVKRSEIFAGLVKCFKPGFTGSPGFPVLHGLTRFLAGFSNSQKCFYPDRKPDRFPV